MNRAHNPPKRIESAAQPDIHLQSICLVKHRSPLLLLPTWTESLQLESRILLQLIKIMVTSMLAEMTLLDLTILALMTNLTPNEEVPEVWRRSSSSLSLTRTISSLFLFVVALEWASSLLDTPIQFITNRLLVKFAWSLIDLNRIISISNEWQINLANMLTLW